MMVPPSVCNPFLRPQYDYIVELTDNLSRSNRYYRLGFPVVTLSDSYPGLPHYGHLLTSTIKDIIPRYWSMKGYHVIRRFGWDTHGVPVEFEIDKKLGISGRDAVLKMGQSRSSPRALLIWAV